MMLAFVRLASSAAPKPPRTGLEDREPAGPDTVSPEAHFAAYARHLLAKDAES